MRFFITCDSYWGARVEKVLDALDNTGYKQFSAFAGVLHLHFIRICNDKSQKLTHKQ